MSRRRDETACSERVKSYTLLNLTRGQRLLTQHKDMREAVHVGEAVELIEFVVE